MIPTGPLAVPPLNVAQEQDHVVASSAKTRVINLRGHSSQWKISSRGEHVTRAAGSLSDFSAWRDTISHKILSRRVFVRKQRESNVSIKTGI